MAHKVQGVKVVFFGMPQAFENYCKEHTTNNHNRQAADYSSFCKVEDANQVEIGASILALS